MGAECSMKTLSCTAFLSNFIQLSSSVKKMSACCDIRWKRGVKFTFPQVQTLFVMKRIYLFSISDIKGADTNK